MKLNIEELTKIAKVIITSHKLKTKVKFINSNNKANYDWDSDIITVNTHKQKSLEDFIETILHEVDHALMRKTLGANKYEKAYTLAGQREVDNGNDFYDDNPFEIRAEKYAKQNSSKWIKKILHFSK
jgi:hypothetical protein